MKLSTETQKNAEMILDRHFFVSAKMLRWNFKMAFLRSATLAETTEV